MSNTATVDAVLRHPAYQTLLRRRNRISLLFFGATLAIYAGFILTLAYQPELFGRPIAAGMTLSIGVLTGTLVAISAVVLVAGYVYVSNKVFDPLLARIVKDVQS